MQTLELLVEAIQKVDPQPDFIIYTGMVIVVVALALTIVVKAPCIAQ